MATIIVSVKLSFDKSPGFGNTQWVHWYREKDGSWTGHCWQKGLISRRHRCGVEVGMQNSTQGNSGTIVFIAPQYKGQGEWEWSTYLECDVPPLGDTLARVASEARMTRKQIESFKVNGMCWKPSPRLDSVCLFDDEHEGPCGWERYERVED